MIVDVLHRFALLFETSPEIESRPFLTRPRTMAAAWGGLMLCKLLSIALIDPTYGITAFSVIGMGGAIATQVRFRHEHAPRTEPAGSLAVTAIAAR